MKMIYIAGAYSGETLTLAANIRKGRRVAADLALKGFYAFYCPWLDLELAVLEDLPMEAFQQNGLEHLRRSDCVLLVPGWEESRGTKRELELAHELGLPVFQAMWELEKWMVEAGK